jgi:hypothetical protein
VVLLLEVFLGFNFTSITEKNISYSNFSPHPTFDILLHQKKVLQRQIEKNSYFNDYKANSVAKFYIAFFKLRHD